MLDTVQFSVLMIICSCCGNDEGGPSADSLEAHCLHHLDSKTLVP